MRSARWLRVCFLILFGLGAWSAQAEEEKPAAVDCVMRVDGVAPDQVPMQLVGFFQQMAKKYEMDCPAGFIMSMPL